MKKSLMATVATVALIAGSGLAAAEGAPKQEAPAQRTEAPAPAPSAQQKAPAEKMAPGAKVDMKSDTKASTTGQAEPKGSTSKAADQKSEPSKSPMKSSESTKSDNKADTKTDSKSAAQPSSQRNAADSKSDASKSGTAAQSTTSPDSKSQTTGSAPSGQTSVQLTGEQKTKIRSTVLTSSAPRVTNVNFSIHVGTVVPRTVRVVEVPPTLIEIHPAWRGKRYFVYNDEIIIVEPDTYKIVEVIVL
jgi:hypothetical protein